MNERDYAADAVVRPVTAPEGAAVSGHRLDEVRLAPPGIWLLVLAAGAVAGGLAWVLSEPYVDYHKPPVEISDAAYDFIALNREQSAANTKNAAIVFGLFGGLLGGLAGLAAGLASRSSRLAPVAALVGLAVGALAGALPAFGIIPVHYRNFNEAEIEMHSYFLPLAAGVHFTLWGPIGAAAGLAMAIGLRGFQPRAIGLGLLGGLVGALVGTVLFEGLGAVLFPFDRTSDPMSTTPTTRLIARLMIAVFSVLGAAVTLTRPATKRSGPARATLE